MRGSFVHGCNDGDVQTYEAVIPGDFFLIYIRELNRKKQNEKLSILRLHNCLIIYSTVQSK